MTRRPLLGAALFALAFAAPRAFAEDPVADPAPLGTTADDATDAAQAPAPPEPKILRRRPGSPPESEPGPEPPPPLPALPSEFVPVPDRWRLVEGIGVHEHWWDPYNQNTFKADRPIFGNDWFVNFAAISDSLVEPRRLPTPVGLQLTRKNGVLDSFGEGAQLGLVQNVILSASLIQGNTVFRPPDWEFRVTPAFNVNYASVQELGLLNVNPQKGDTRFDYQIGLQELFVDRHITNVSNRYDFVSVRAGVQGFSADFRGFLFQDNRLGARVFGNWNNNLIQYNLAYFRTIEKDINSGLNTIMPLRNDDVYLANVYFQDVPVKGFTMQAIVAYNRNTEGNHRYPHYDENGFQERPSILGAAVPRNYDAVYIGTNGDGHFGPVNLTYGVYFLTGEDQPNPFTQKTATLLAGFAAGEASMDFDWLRVKAFGFYASGDRNPFDDTETGFDAIFENPQFAGADTAFWMRQGIPLIGGGFVAISPRNAIIPDLRPSKEQGQSSFVGPGIGLVGVGADFDVLPELRLLTNVSYLEFDDTTSLSVLRNQGRIDNEIGTDVSAAVIYRPFFIQNVVLRLSGAVLFPGKGLRQLFSPSDTSPYYSCLANLVLTY
jgi:hypothetical protein